MSTPSLLVLDQGTSVTRAALYRGGRLVVESRRPVEILFPAPGRAEQDARELAATAASVLEECAAALHAGEPAALGITNQRSTLVLWDAEDGRPLGPALSWRDARASAEAERLAAAVPDLARRTGLPATAHYGAPKLAWALAHWPEARKAAEAGRLRVGPVSTWLAWKLSRGASFTIDPTNAQRLLLLDLHSLAWDAALAEAAGCPLDALPLVLPTDGYFGDAHVGGRVLPIRAMLGDQQAALLGHGPHADGEVAVHLGTGGFVLADTGSEARFVDGLLAGLALAPANAPRRYLVEGTVNSVGSAFDRLRDMGILAAGEDVDALCRQSARPLVVVPAWAGLGAPHWSSRARAAVLGWDESSTRADVVLGTVRGIAFLVADVVERLRHGGVDARRLALSGSVSRVTALAQALADATDAEARVRTNPEASLEGLAQALATAAEGQAPALSLEAGPKLAPRQSLAEERAAFREALAVVRR